MTDARAGRRVMCKITDKYGNTVQTSSAVLDQAVKITKQPTGAAAASGKTVKVTVAASGTGLTYQWYVKNPGSSSFTKSSVTGSTYSYTMSSAKSGRQVYCVVKDAYGNTVKTKTVTLSLLAVTKQPVSATAKSGTKAKTTVTAVGDGLTYQWYVKNPGSSTYTKSSITKATYSCSMSAANNGRQVYCVITDKYGNTVTTNTVRLRMTAAT